VLLEAAPPAWLQGKALLIFDFDGTVADTSLLHAAAFSEVLSPLGVPVHYEAIAGLKTADAMLLCARAAGLELGATQLAALVAAKQSSVRQMIAGGLKPLPGVDAFLRWAKPRFTLAMATSGSRASVQMALDALGYADWFTPLVCAEDVAHGKPHPDAFLRALALAGIDARHAVVFEDSEAGFAAARAAGIAYVDARANLWHRLEGATA
jgi:HAD superfamily hydrolase (TIGR01509 family)